MNATIRGKEEKLQCLLENFSYFIEEIKTWVGYDLYVKKFILLENHLLIKLRKLFSSRSGKGFNVLNHGDLSYKNLMLKGDGTNEQINVLFVSYIDINGVKE